MRCPGHKCHVDPGLNAKRVQFDCVIHLLHSFVVSPQGLDKASVLQMCVCIVRIEFECELELLLCLGPVPVIFEGLGQRKMSLREGGIEFECLGGRILGVRQSLFRGMTSPGGVSQYDMCV